MATFIASQQELSKTADANLYAALSSNGTAADYIGFLVAHATGDLQKGLDAMKAVEEGTFKVSTSQTAAQTKNLAEATTITDIKGEPTAKIVIGGQEYDISSILQSTVYYWDQGNAKNPNYHLREVFTGLGSEAPDDYDPDWDQPQAPVNQAPVTTDDSAETDEDTPVDGDLRDNASDDDSDDLTYVLTDADGNVIDAPDGLTWNGDGTWSFDPSGRYDHLDDDEAPANFTFYYKVNDGTEDSNVSSVTITINGINDAPTAETINVTAMETLSAYNPSHQITNQNLPADNDQKVVDLLSTTVDPDDPLSVSNFLFFDKDGKSIDKPSYITINGTDLIIEQNHPDLNALKNGEHLLLSMTYTISDGDEEITNTVNIDITGTADQYKGIGSDSNAHDREHGNKNGQILFVDTSKLPDDAFDLSGTLSVSSSGLEPVAPNFQNEQSTVSDPGGNDWGSNSITITDAASPISRPLTSGALDDHKVDYNISFNGNADIGDKVTVTLNYEYWFVA